MKENCEIGQEKKRFILALAYFHIFFLKTIFIQKIREMRQDQYFLQVPMRHSKGWQEPRLQGVRYRDLEELRPPCVHQPGVAQSGSQTSARRFEEEMVAIRVSGGRRTFPRRVVTRQRRRRLLRPRRLHDLCHVHRPPGVLLQVEARGQEGQD